MRSNKLLGLYKFHLELSMAEFNGTEAIFRHTFLKAVQAGAFGVPLFREALTEERNELIKFLTRKVNQVLSSPRIGNTPQSIALTKFDHSLLSWDIDRQTAIQLDFIQTHVGNIPVIIGVETTVIAELEG